MKNHSWTLTAKVKTEGAKTQGVIMAFGGVAAGLVLYVKDGVPVFDYNYFEKHTVDEGFGDAPPGGARHDRGRFRLSGPREVGRAGRDHPQGGRQAGRARASWTPRSQVASASTRSASARTAASR